MPRSDISWWSCGVKLKGRARLTNNDRWFFAQLYRWFPSILPVLMIIRSETPVGIEPAFAAIGIGNRVDGRRPPIEAENRHVSAVESEYKALRRDRSIFLASPLATTPSMSECVMAFVTKRLNASDLLMPI